MGLSSDRLLKWHPLFGPIRRKQPEHRSNLPRGRPKTQAVTSKYLLFHTFWKWRNAWNISLELTPIVSMFHSLWTPKTSRRPRPFPPP